jgi:cytochrome c-type biogenesis protein CcmH
MRNELVMSSFQRTREPGGFAVFTHATTLGSRVRGNDGIAVIARFAAMVVASIVLVAIAHGKEAAPEAADPVLEARMVRITSELRCLVCQNQTIADSHADLAVDLRKQVREQLVAGRSDAEIVDYMTARYGDFVLYRPPFKATTVLLWVGPAAMLGGGLLVLAIVLRRRSRLAPDAFEADDDEPLASHPDVGRA